MPNPLEAYQEKLGSLTTWEPFPAATALQRELTEALRDRNDPRDWLAFGASAASLAWQSLPEDLRSDAQAALIDLTQRALQGLGSLGQEIGTAVGNAAEVLPLIGALIQAVIDLVIGIEKGTRDNDRISSDASFNRGQYKTVEQYARPDQWVAQRMNVGNYLAMSSPHVASLFRVRPTLRQSENADKVWLGSAGPKDRGWCGDGVVATCPPFFEAGDYISQCNIADRDAGNVCKRVTAVSCLLFPWSFVAYPPGPRPLRDTGSWDVNELLAQRQLALLSNPAANLTARGEAVRSLLDRVHRAFIVEAAKLHVDSAAYGLVKLGNDGSSGTTAPEDRYTVDKSKRADYVPGAKDRARFYFRPDGIIEPYAGDDPARWGVPMQGPPAQPTLGLSVAAHNTAVAAVSAFFAARASMLRSGPALKAMLQSVKLESIDPEARAVVDYVAKTGKMQPPAPARAAKLPERAAKLPERAQRETGAAAALGIGGLLLLLLRFLAR